MRLKNYPLVISILLITSANLLFAQETVKKYSIGQTIKLSSKALGEERKVHIYLPTGYEQSMQKYPVLYILDGETHFHHGSGVVQFLAANGRIPQMIVVAIPNTKRGRDFTPTVSERIPESGGADIFLTFLQNELIPFIENNFRTQPYRILFGHSLTGMFSVYTMIERPYLFQSFISASPYLQYEDDVVVKKAQDSLNTESVKEKTIYLAIGDEPNYEPARAKFIDLLEGLSDTGLQWKFPKMSGANHGSVVHLTLYNGLEFIFSGWNLSADQATDFSNIKKHYQNLSDKFHFQVDPPEFLFNRLGYQLMAKEEYKQAIKIFEKNAKLYPRSSNVYDSLGEAFEKSGNLKSAKKNYAIAVEKGEETKSRNLAVYKTNLERVQNLLK